MIFQGSKKVGCKANVKIMECIKFPQYKVRQYTYKYVLQYLRISVMSMIMLNVTLSQKSKCLSGTKNIYSTAFGKLLTNPQTYVSGYRYFAANFKIICDIQVTNLSSSCICNAKDLLRHEVGQNSDVCKQVAWLVCLLAKDQHTNHSLGKVL